MDIIEEAAERSVDLLERAATPAGFVASPVFDHYSVIWARDALISSLGALTTGLDPLTNGVAHTLDSLTARCSDLGQVPALVSVDGARWDFGEGGAVDPTAWLPIVVAAYVEATGDVDRASGWWDSCVSAMRWLKHQDVTGSGLISVAPSTDWMDAALTRSGRTLHMNVLYAWANRAMTELSEALGLAGPDDGIDVSRLVNDWFWPAPDTAIDDLFAHGFSHTAIKNAHSALASRPRNHYVSHIVHAGFVDVCDVLANCLAIHAGVADAARADAILAAIDTAARPWPTRTFLEPIESHAPDAMLIQSVDEVIDPRWSNRPGAYHNAAAWPYVGGFHVAAATRHTDTTTSVELLRRLAEVNALDEWRFSEWIGVDGERGAAQQTWNAGTYLLAYTAHISR